MRNFYFFILIMLTICVGACNNQPIIENIIRKHFNVIVVPDLSNRISNNCFIKPDEFLVEQFIKLLYPDIINYKRSVNQYDVYRLDFINKQQIAAYQSHTVTIDLKHFNNEQVKRNEYLGIFESTSNFKKDTFQFVETIRDLHKKVLNSRPFGADVYDYLERLNSNQIYKDVDSITDNVHREKIINYYENIVIILTDGYIETGKINDPKLSLSEKRIDNFRTEYLSDTHNLTPDSFYKVNRAKYAIKPINNKLLAHSKIVVLQLWDRGFTSGQNKHEKLSDLKIIKLFWNDWLLNSGVKQDNILLYSSDETIDEQSTKDVFKKVFGLK